ncbi:hypothetical protein NQ317_001499, partial [Molorchus minor]
MPDKPVATEGSAVTLTCTAMPPGWPAPQYRWFRISTDGQNTIIATGTKYTIANANLGTEGVYNCQATNELGPGEIASVDLEVHQPPNFKYKLKPLETKRVGDPNFSVSCSAKGKPKPMVKWLKDDEELTADVNMFEVKTEDRDNGNGAVSVQSVLKFNGRARPNGNELLPSDRGFILVPLRMRLKKSESAMHLKIEPASTNSNNQPHHMNVDRQNSYGYDPITHGGYGAVDDYAPYPHITTQSNHGDDYMRNSNNPSRQDYCSDSYAAVHKPKKRIEQHI